MLWLRLILITKLYTGVSVTLNRITDYRQRMVEQSISCYLNLREWEVDLGNNSQFHSESRLSLPSFIWSCEIPHQRKNILLQFVAAALPNQIQNI